MSTSTSCSSWQCSVCAAAPPALVKTYDTQLHPFPHDPHPDPLALRPGTPQEEVPFDFDIALGNGVVQLELEPAEHGRDSEIQFCVRESEITISILVPRGSVCGQRTACLGTCACLWRTPQSTDSGPDSLPRRSASARGRRCVGFRRWMGRGGHRGRSY